MNIKKAKHKMNMYTESLAVLILTKIKNLKFYNFNSLLSFHIKCKKRDMIKVTFHNKLL